MKYLFLLLTAAALTFHTVQEQITASSTLSDVLQSLGEETPAHALANTTPEMVASGERIIKKGRASKADPYVSKFYTCTSCHNVVREDVQLNKVDPKSRLAYAMDNKIPYLQGSTFWGMVNRESWYNDDYILKYGDLVANAQYDLKASIQLCATVCSQGRLLTEKEMNEVLAYLWTLEITVGDLGNVSLTTLNDKDIEDEQKISLLKSYYLQKSPATFGELPKSKASGYPHEGDRKLGKAIYQQGCQHCHRPDGESDVVFEDNELSYNYLKRNITADSKLSIYEIIRKGTYSAYGHREYMPHYTLEKMSDQQIEHLRAFLENPL